MFRSTAFVPTEARTLSYHQHLTISPDPRNKELRRLLGPANKLNSYTRRKWKKQCPDAHWHANWLASFAYTSIQEIRLCTCRRTLWTCAAFPTEPSHYGLPKPSIRGAALHTISVDPPVHLVPCGASSQSAHDGSETLATHEWFLCASTRPATR
jgi:hypothetical protein